MNYNSLKDEIIHTWLKNSSHPLAKLHFAMYEVIRKQSNLGGKRRVYNCTNLGSALGLLEKMKLLSPTNLDILVELSDQLKGPTEMIKSRIDMASLGSSTSCTCKNSPQTFKNQSNNYEIPSANQKVHEYLSEEMGTSWIDFGRHLPGMTNRTLELAQNKSIRQKDKILTILKEYEISHRGNSLDDIKRTLRVCQMNRQHDYISRLHSGK